MICRESLCMSTMHQRTPAAAAAAMSQPTFTNAFRIPASTPCAFGGQAKATNVATQERWPEKLLFNHESGCLNMMQLAFCHGMIDGEHLTLALPPEGFSYRNLLTLDRMRAQYMGHNCGFVPIFLPEFTRAGEGNDALCNRFMLTEEPPEVMHLVGLLALHDILPWNAYSNPAPHFHWWAVQDAFGWGDEVEFLPYWSNRDLVSLSPDDPNLVCTIYRQPGKALFVVMNNTDEDRDVTLQPNWGKLGLQPPAARPNRRRRPAARCACRSILAA
jgi:hypothetical protein